jgi:proteasome-associated ATPase
LENLNMKKTVPIEFAGLAELLAVAGELMPSEGGAACLQRMRVQSAEASAQLDGFLLEHVGILRRGLADAKSQIRKVQSILEKLSAPPWHPAIFHQMVTAAGGEKAIVQIGANRRVVSLAEGVDIKTLGRGDEVFLNHEQNVIVAKSPDGGPSCGETATFERRLPGARMLLRSRDEAVVVHAASKLQDTECKPGDAVRFDRILWLAFEKVEREAGRRYLLEDVPNLTRDQVGGQEANLDALLSALTTVLVEPAKAAAYHLTGRNSILMYGPPGCGKTLMARVAVSEISRLTGKKASFAAVKPSEWESPWVGQTQENIRQFFQALREKAEAGFAVAFLDEVDSVGRIRGGMTSQHSDKFLAAFLAEMDGFADRKNVAIIAATNRKDLLDAALHQRCSDLEISVGRPDLRGARAIFRIHLPDSVPYHPNGELAKSTRDELIELAVSKFYSPNAGNELCKIRFRDGKERTIVARELASGRLFEQVCRAARRNAFLRDVRGGTAGVQLADMEEAVGQTLDQMRTILTIHNARAYLGDLPQDMDVVSVEPIVRKVKKAHHYLHRAAA